MAVVVAVAAVAAAAVWDDALAMVRENGFVDRMDCKNKWYQFLSISY